MEEAERQVVIETLEKMGVNVKNFYIEVIISVYHLCQEQEISLTLEEITRTIVSERK